MEIFNQFSWMEAVMAVIIGVIFANRGVNKKFQALTDAVASLMMSTEKNSKHMVEVTDAFKIFGTQLVSLETKHSERLSRVEATESKHSERIIRAEAEITSLKKELADVKKTTHITIEGMSADHIK